MLTLEDIRLMFPDYGEDAILEFFWEMNEGIENAAPHGQCGTALQ